MTDPDLSEGPSGLPVELCLTDLEAAVVACDPAKITACAYRLKSSIPFITKQYSLSLNGRLLDVANGLDVANPKDMTAGAAIAKVVAYRTNPDGTLHKRALNLWSRCFDAVVDTRDAFAMAIVMNISNGTSCSSIVNLSRRRIAARISDISDETVQEVFQNYDLLSGVLGDAAMEATIDPQSPLRPIGAAAFSRGEQTIGLMFHEALLKAGRLAGQKLG
jgi:hypothetical protein